MKALYFLSLLLAVKLVHRAEGVQCYDASCSPTGQGEDHMCPPPVDANKAECEHGCYSLNVTSPLDKGGVVYRACVEEKFEKEECYETTFHAEDDKSEAGRGIYCPCKTDLCNLPHPSEPEEPQPVESPKIKPHPETSIPERTNDIKTALDRHPPVEVHDVHVHEHKNGTHPHPSDSSADVKVSGLVYMIVMSICAIFYFF